MSWSSSGLVADGDTTKLEESFAASPVNDSASEQREFVLNVIHEAFDAAVVEGAYSVSCGGHSDPTVEGDRKSLFISMSPTVAAEGANENIAAQSEAAAQGLATAEPTEDNGGQ